MEHEVNTADVGMSDREIEQAQIARQRADEQLVDNYARVYMTAVVAKQYYDELIKQNFDPATAVDICKNTLQLVIP